MGLLLCGNERLRELINSHLRQLMQMFCFPHIKVLCDYFPVDDQQKKTTANLDPYRLLLSKKVLKRKF